MNERSVLVTCAMVAASLNPARESRAALFAPIWNHRVGRPDKTRECDEFKPLDTGAEAHARV